MRIKLVSLNLIIVLLLSMIPYNIFADISNISIDTKIETPDIENGDEEIPLLYIDGQTYDARENHGSNYMGWNYYYHHEREIPIQLSIYENYSGKPISVPYSANIYINCSNRDISITGENNQPAIYVNGNTLIHIDIEEDIEEAKSLTTKLLGGENASAIKVNGDLEIRVYANQDSNQNLDFILEGSGIDTPAIEATNVDTYDRLFYVGSNENNIFLTGDYSNEHYVKILDNIRSNTIKLSGDTIVPHAPLKNKFTFLGWNSKNDWYMNGSSLSAGDGILLNAKYLANTRINVAILLNGNAGKNNESDYYVTFGSYNDLKSYKTPQNPFKRDGYTFKGYNTQADGSGKDYKENDFLDNDGSTLIYSLFAQWQCTHRNSTSQPTTTESAICSICGEIIPAKSSSSGSSSGGGGGGTGGSSASETTNVTNDDGSKTTTSVNSDTGETVIVTKTKDGIVGTINKDKDGKISSIDIDISRVSGSTNTVKIPKTVLELENAKNSTYDINIKISEKSDVKTIFIPIKNPDMGIVIINVDSNGEEKIIKNSFISEDSIIFSINQNTKIRISNNVKVFNDIRNNYWAKNDIDFVTSRGLFNGVSTERFDPNGTVTRAMLITILARLNDADLSGESVNWYDEALKWAVKNGISDGTYPENSITREQLITMLYRYSNEPSIDNTNINIEKFNDYADISSYARQAMYWGIDSGLINGIGNNMLCPQESATRAQLTAIIHRYCKLLYLDI